MTKKELIEKVATDNGLTKKETETIVNSVLNTIIETTKTDKVVLAGFGTFETKTNAAREGINPFTKQPMKIAESKNAKFKPAKAFKDSLN
jgi:DNA-binding protein HU-beta